MGPLCNHKKHNKEKENIPPYISPIKEKEKYRLLIFLIFLPLLFPL